MSKQQKNIRQLIGDDGEFNYPLDGYIQENYTKPKYPPQSAPTGGIGFSDEYLASLQHNHKKFTPPWYENEVVFVILMGLGFMGMIALLCLIGLFFAVAI